jgi:predicted MFS family arabinose efflux permease
MPDSDARTVILRRCARMWPPSALLPAVRTRLGGPARARVIVLFACLLGLETADLASLGAIAGQLKPALHLDNTQLGILAAAPALVAIFATLPLGVLADRTRRTPVLAMTTATWAVAMLLSAASSSFDELLVARFFLGAATAASAPLIASLVGDLFWPEERGRVYGYILGGQLLGSSFGLLVIGNLTAFSWRVALVALALPSVALALAIARLLPEPARGGASRLQQGARKIHVPKGTRRWRRGRRDTAEHAPHRDPAVERVVRRAKVEPREGLVLREDPFAMPLKRAVVYVLRLPTNVLLIISSALGYFFQAGVNTFGVVFVIAHFGVSQMAATSLLALVALGALAGNVIGGRIADGLLARGYLPARMVVGGTAFVASSAIFVPGLLTRNLLVAMLLYFVAAVALSAPSPTLDAARLDIVPGRLWGRAEAIRTVLRTLAVAAAPLMFGFVSDELSSGPRATTREFAYHANGPGLKYAFLLMLIPLAISGLILLRGTRAYERDAATALASEAAIHGVTSSGDGAADRRAAKARGRVPGRAPQAA